DWLLTVPIDLSTIAPTPGARARFYRTAVEAVTGVPGVERAALAMLIPLDGSNSTTDIELRHDGGVTKGVIDLNIVGAGYFSMLAVPVLQGREFTASDREGSPRVAVVNETLARMAWQGHAIGRRFVARAERQDFEV